MEIDASVIAKVKSVPTKLIMGRLYVNKENPGDIYLYSQVGVREFVMVGMSSGNRFLDANDPLAVEVWDDVTDKVQLIARG